MATLEGLRTAIIDGAAEKAVAHVAEALEEGVDASTILSGTLIPAMAEVGRRFEKGEFFVPEMLVAARAMKEALRLLKPRLAAAAVEPAGRVALGTVRGDLHDIGKNLVSMMLEGAGFEVLDLGVDVPPERFADAVRGGVGIIGMSALLTTTMPMMKTTIEHLAQMGLRGAVRVMVGGAPVTEAFARSIGADLYASDASAAARGALSLVAREG